MLTPEQVNQVVASFVAAVKPYYKEGEIKPYARGVGVQRHNMPKWPEFWGGYNTAVKQRDELRVHIESDVFPDHLFVARAPNQTEDEYKYARANFKQTTLPEYSDFENTILRALHESNWSLTPGEAAGDVEDEGSFTHYVSKRIDNFGGLSDYFKHIIPKIKTLDPMGVICVLPRRIPTVEQTGEDGEPIIVMDPDTLVDPQPMYFSVDRIVGKEDGVYYLLLTDQRSTVQVGGKDVKQGLVLWLVDDTVAYRVAQYGKAHELNFETSVYFEHNTGFVPCEPLKGRPVLRDGHVSYESYYLPAKDLLDLVLLDSSNLTAIKAASVFPQKVMLGYECEHTDVSSGGTCHGGEWMVYDAEIGAAVQRGKCPSCKGTGMSVSLGPNRVLMVKAANMRGETQGQLSVRDAMAYVEPSSTTPDVLEKQIEINRNAARKMLHLHSETPIAGGDSATATEVGVGVKAQSAFIAPIASQIFGTMEFCLAAIAMQRYGESDGYFELVPATQYDLRTEADYIALLGEAQSKGLPPAAIEEILRGYFAIRYASDPYMKEAFDVVAMADGMLTANWQQVQAMQGKGQVQAWEIALHNRALSMYDELMRDPTFRGLDVYEKAQRLKEFAQQGGKDIEAPLTPAQRAAELVRQTEEGGTTEIQIQPNMPTEDVQATALNGAQVESLVTIINQVAAGVITKETAKPLIQSAFPGIDDNKVTEMLNGVKAIPVDKAAQVVK